ncbi:MAG TPA: MBL fold hydrolase, partial [Eubacteriaceae bacterium]|nr:MBL fold hydrolase [Eubacteriaceae bacterium]
FPFDPEELDFVVLTHAHIDHSGRIPKLFKEEGSPKIYTNKATVELCDIMLQDSAHIQEMEMEWKNKKRERKGLPLLEPRYTMEDAIGSISLFEGIEYGKTIYFGGTLEITLINSGHMLGSSFVLIRVYEKDRWNRYLFTGDMGNTNMPLIKDPAYIDEIDYLIIESTYGNRVHETKMEEDKLLEIILKTARKGGNVVIPSFAVGRTQEVLYEINRYKENNMLEEHDDIPVYVDSPLAIKATEVFKQNCK